MTDPSSDSMTVPESCQKDACNYAVELAKQFLTLSSAGIAFVVGSTFAETHSIPAGPSRTALWVFGGSIAVGLIFLMHIVGKIGKGSNYDVYKPIPRVMSGAQIALFVIGILVLAKATFARLAVPLPASSTVNVDFQDVRLRQEAVPGREVRIVTSTDSSLQVNIGKPTQRDSGR